MRDGAAKPDAAQASHCDLCGEDTDAVASTGLDGGGPFACKACLRHRLEAMTVGSFLLRQPGDSGLPWGKVSG